MFRICNVYKLMINRAKWAEQIVPEFWNFSLFYVKYEVTKIIPENLSWNLTGFL